MENQNHEFRLNIITILTFKPLPPFRLEIKDRNVVVYSVGFIRFYAFRSETLRFIHPSLKMSGSGPQRPVPGTARVPEDAITDADNNNESEV